MKTKQQILVDIELSRDRMSDYSNEMQQLRAKQKYLQNKFDKESAWLNHCCDLSEKREKIPKIRLTTTTSTLESN